VDRGARLNAQDWADAALIALRSSGAGGVAIEPLARALGATKGSFYWHYRNRKALLEAALGRWEAQETDAVIARPSAVVPRRRSCTGCSRSSWRTPAATPACM
jgi:AcrR family transcriptional regulator